MLTKRNKGLGLVAALLALCSVLLTCMVSRAASNDYTNDKTGYMAIIRDEANLLTDSEEAALLKKMADITGSGNAAFYTTDASGGYEAKARAFYTGQFGSQSGMVFMIDMYNRQIYIYTTGAVGRVLTVAYCNTITDNVYKMATKGDYFGCAYEAFDETVLLLSGSRISQPMKYINNLLIAIILGILIMYFVARMQTRRAAATNEETLRAIQANIRISNPRSIILGTNRIYSPQSSGSSGGGGGGGGGGGHGGGHGF